MDSPGNLEIVRDVLEDWDFVRALPFCSHPAHFAWGNYKICFTFDDVGFWFKHDL